MSGSISTRISLRWLPDPPSEPTDTLVYNVGSYFLDLRVLKADGSIDWAMAGERVILSEDPLKCRWIKMIDSTGPSEPDEATFTTLPNGDDLETGRMPCPHKNNDITEFEEVWRRLPPISGAKHAWILQSVDGKTFLGKNGGGYMALYEGVNGFGARREERDVDGDEGWKVKYEIGPVEGVPSLARIGKGGKEGFEEEEGWRVDDCVEIQGKDYIVRAWEALSGSP